jgi:mRNA interferase MazF
MCELDKSRVNLGYTQKDTLWQTLLKGFNLEVVLPEGLITSGVVLAFQVKTINWVERQVKYIESLPGETIEEVISKLQVLLG